MKKLALLFLLLVSLTAFAAKKPVAPPFNVAVDASYDGGTVTGTFTFTFVNASAIPNMTNWDFTVGTDKHYFNHGFGNENSGCGIGGSNQFFIGSHSQYAAYSICGDNLVPEGTGTLYLIFDRNFLNGSVQLVTVIPVATTADGVATVGAGLYEGPIDFIIPNVTPPTRQILAGTLTNTNLPALMSCRVN